MPVVARNQLRRYALRNSAFTKLSQSILDLADDPTSELNIELVGNRRMQGLNRQYRGVDQTTDVLAFSLRESPGPPTPLLGDVVIAVPVAERQARDLGHSLDEEVVRLLIHGVLHLAGYDHERGEKDARRMRRQEQKIFQALQPVPKLLHMKRKDTHGLVR